MRYKFSNNHEVAHIWANQSQDRANGPSMFFRDSMIFSYGEHFCIAKHMPDGSVAFTTRTYSNTTSRHCSIARAAVSHRRIIEVADPMQSGVYNLECARHEITSLLGQASNPRIKEATRLRLKGEALRRAEDANQFARLSATDDRELFLIDTEKLELIPEEIERERQRQIEEASRKLAQEIERTKEGLEKWKRHEETYMSFFRVPPALRLSEDGQFIETSHGANIPVGEGKRLWRLIMAVKTAGRDFMTTRRLGYYTLTQVRADGGIVVGCHDIAFSEVEAIAKQLGLIKEEVV